MDLSTVFGSALGDEREAADGSRTVASASHRALPDEYEQIHSARAHLEYSEASASQRPETPRGEPRKRRR